MSFVRKLNAGLIPRQNPTQKVVLAVHSTWDPFFHDRQSEKSGPLRYAAPFECLVDLIDLGYARETAEMAHDLIQEIPQPQPSESR